MNAPKLGPTQQSIYQSLIRHGDWYPGCGWIWTNRSMTIRLLESLVRRGFAIKEERTANRFAGYRRLKSGKHELLYKPTTYTAYKAITDKVTP